MELDIFNPSRQLRRAVLFWLSMLLAVMSAFLTVVNIASGTYSFHHYNEVAFGVLSLVVGYFTYRKYTSKPLVTAYVYCLIASTSIATYYYPIKYGVFLWACLFPVVFYLILGRRYGFLATGVGFITQLAIVLHRIMGEDVISSIHLVLNFSLVFLAIWVTAHVLEVKRRVSEASLGQLASRDALTGVYNRHALSHNFERYRNESRKLPMSLLVLDLDFFKSVNDRYGHDVGDKVLMQTAALLDSLSDEHLVYRIGGEEFCVALHDTGLDSAKMKAEQIRNAIECYCFNTPAEPIALTASIGVYLCNHYANLESVLREADKELYHAKKNGRNQVKVCNLSPSKLSFLQP